MCNLVEEFLAHHRVLWRLKTWSIFSHPTVYTVHVGSLQPSSIAPFSKQQGNYPQDNMQTYASGRLEQIKTACHGPELRSGSDRPTGILEVVKTQFPSFLERVQSG
ncbi:uncharacterized protein BO88DRAFT_400013 [Aspergillus vadensis CBS 113365]|uniref:Uncharacterized protein n=1 Tax=Aspergillus vadensis (strain CBS 113365 / IMI 142717 / IBT 24658) TaxID=1448311 RepID=A0A319CG47_ASPVC|nr:hypothetical protein BO88DRAFT_400013 [Aspergillus vadensis CBS 113365]PYH74328.1 hypothetical protein BO88DRAFT_400013 [Aspergillus vadensis CBS 113365]